MLGNRKYRIGLIIAVLGVLAGAALWWFSRDKAPRFVKRDPSRRVTRAFVPPSGANAAQASGVQPSWLLEPGVEGRRIAGKVVYEDAPVAGVRVQLRAEHLSLTNTAPPTVTTNAAGQFGFGTQPPAVYVAMATSDGFRASGVRVNLRNPATEPAPDAVVIELSKCDAWTFGVVHDAYGGVVVDGFIAVATKIDERSWFEELFSVPIEEDGSFSICRPRERQHLWVKAPGYGSVWLRGPMLPEGWNVRLFPEGTVEGKVVDEDEQPIEGARVVLLGGFFGGGLQGPIAQTVMSQADGSFQFKGIAPGTYDAAADHGRYGTGGEWPSVTVIPGEETTGVVVKMQSCRSLAGLVLADGEPVVGTRAGSGYEAITQSDGSFLIGCAQFEQFEFKVQRYDVLEPTVPEGKEDIDDLIVRVRPRFVISGRVTADGNPVKESVVAVGDPTGFVGLLSMFGENYRTKTDADGRYKLEGVPAGTHEVNAWDPESKRRSKPRSVAVSAQSRSDGVDLELSHAGGIAGIVVDPVGNPVPHVEIHLSGGDPPSGDSTLAPFPGASYSDTTDEAGTFRIGGLAAGTYSVCLGWCYKAKNDPRYLPRDGDEWPDIELRDSDRDIEVQLVIRGRMGLSISGRVRYDNGSPVSFAVIRTGRRDAQATAGEDGTFVLEGLAEGEYDLEALAQDGSASEVKGIAAGSNSVEIAVPRVGVIEGTVVGGSGTCTVKARLRELSDAGVEVLSGGTSAVGVRDFSFPGVRPGDYRIEARCKEGVATATVNVSPGKLAKTKLEAGAAGTVRGTATLFPSGKPAGGVSCHGGRASGTTNWSGEFELTQVLPGDVRVMCGSWGGTAFSTGVAEVNVPAGETGTVEVFIVEGSMLRDLSKQLKPEDLLGAKLEPAPSENPAALSFSEVLSGGPAGVASIEDSDILLSVAGTSAVGNRSTAAGIYIQSRPPGTELELIVRRNGQQTAITLILGSPPPGEGP